MKFVSGSTPTAEVLNRVPFEGVPLTLDFRGVTTTDDTTKKRVIRAGTPIDANGAIVGTTPWTGAVGILLTDVYEERPQATILKRAYVNVTRAQKNSGLTYDAALVNALALASCNIVFEDPILVGSAATEAPAPSGK